MSSKAAIDRLKKEHKRIQKDPIPNIEAVPDETDLLTWHYVIRGPADSVYNNGIYHGKIVFPREYPYKPPSIMMLTPNGRFKTNTRLCLSMSDFHPETWNPLWNVGTILTGVLSFMLENTATYGSIDSTDSEKRKYAAESLAYNIKNDKFCELFPHYKVQHFNNVKQQKQNNNITTDTNTVQHNNVNINNNNTDNNVTERLLNNNNNGTNTQHTLPINNNHNNIQQHNNIDMQPHAHDQNRLYVKLIAISIVSTIILSLWYFLT